MAGESNENDPQLEETTMPLDITYRPQPLAAFVSAGLLLLAAGNAGADTFCTPLSQPGDFAQKLNIIDKTMSRADDICYAEATIWRERNMQGSNPPNVDLRQRFDYFRPASAPLSQKLPLVIWAHPNGETEKIAPNSPRMSQLVNPALEKNFALMSIEFRHPVSSQLAPTNPPTPPQLDIPNTDITRAVQWARAWADELGIDPKNIFLLGQSRGTLGLLTALSPNMASSDGAPYLAQSSRVNAMYAVQAQTTYEQEQIANNFIHKDDRVTFTAKYPDFIKPGSAIKQISVNDPPVAMRYERAPTDPQLKNVVPLHLPNQNGSCNYPQTGCFDLHHPNFGLKLKLAFDAAYLNADQTPPASKFDIAYNLPTANFFSDPLTGRPYICFFMKSLTPAALANQTPAALAACGL